MDVEKVKRQQELYPEVDSVISKTLDNTEDGYRYLYNLKGSIPKELYALLAKNMGHENGRPFVGIIILGRE